MSATAKALMAFHTRHVGASVGGSVWVPEDVYEKLIELARREVKGTSPEDTARANVAALRGGSK